jgi:peroxiredoxin Q/BCP
MPPELRKRKAPASEPATAPPAKKKGPVAKAVAKVKEAITPKSKAKASTTNGEASSAGKVAVGDVITLEGKIFGNNFISFFGKNVPQLLDH